MTTPLTKVKVIVNPDWVEDGLMLVFNADQVRVAYSPAPFVEVENPAKIILVHDEIDRFRMCEAVRESDYMELVEDDDESP